MKRLIKTLINKYYKRKQIQRFVDPISVKYGKLSTHQKLTKEQKSEIKQYYRELTGENVPLIWHEFLYSRTGNYSKKYIPTSLYKVTLLYRANKHGYRDAYADKNMADILLPGVKHPEVVLKNMNGYYYIGGKAVSKDEAVQYCQNLDNVLIKPSLGTHGDGARRLIVKNGITNISGKPIEKVFDDYGENFCIQGFIQQHESMKALNPTSVNTIRVLTYRSGMEILVLYTVVRIGRKDKEIDNESAGGISTVINKDGRLGKYAYGDPGVDKVEFTDSGIRLEGYEVPSYEKVVDTVKRLHYSLPFFNLVGWDVAVGQDGEPILVEWNVCTELSQSANGPAFGEYTDRIITELMQKPNDQNRYW